MSDLFVQIDAFSNRPFGGNPAAVCLLDGPADEDWMQAVATEMNLSETAFLHPEEAGYRLRWFTPGAEVDLCGHATLAAAHYLWEDGHLDRGQPAVFETRSGRLSATTDGEWIELDFPADSVAPVEVDSAVAAALGIEPVFHGSSGLYAFFEVKSEAVLLGLEPDFAQVRALHPVGVTVTAVASGGDYDFISRFFAPAVGIDEDPVTGSAHCALGPYWRERLDKDAMIAYQASKRGGVVKVGFSGDRVLLGGQAVTVVRGEFLTPRP